MTKRLLWLLLPAAGAGAVWLVPAAGSPGASTSVGAEAGAPGPRPLPAAGYVVPATEGWELERTYSGIVRPGRAVELAFEVPGRLAAVLADEGDPVEAGAELGRLEGARPAARLAAIDARLDAERARLAELVAGPREERIAAAGARVRELESELALARLRLERREELVRTDAIASEDRDVARRDVDATAARLDAAREDLRELERGTRAEVLAAQRAAIAVLEAERVALALDLEDSVLRAPFAGVVARRDLDEGAFVQPGQTLLRLVESERPEAKVGVPAHVAATLRIGAELALTAGGRPLVGAVQSLLPELDGATRTTGVVIALPAGAAAPGEAVQLTLREHSDASGLAVPVGALLRGERGLWTVYALAPLAAGGGDLRRVERRDVEVLHVAGDRVLVRGTLAAGEHILAEGVHRVAPQQTVQLLAE
ncbi:MAG: efflux RND transporter periplasmic adaptor subunit [Planctomycetota bacterium]